MHTTTEILPKGIVAALHAAHGVTLDEFWDQHPEFRPGVKSIGPEFDTRYDAARLEWHRVNGWGQIPEDVADRLADQVRSDIAWESGQ